MWQAIQLWPQRFLIGVVQAYRLLLKAWGRLGCGQDLVSQPMAVIQKNLPSLTTALNNCAPVLPSWFRNRRATNHGSSGYWRAPKDRA